MQFPLRIKQNSTYTNTNFKLFMKQDLFATSAYLLNTSHLSPGKLSDVEASFVVFIIFIRTEIRCRQRYGRKSMTQCITEGTKEAPSPADNFVDCCNKEVDVI